MPKLSPLDDSAEYEKLAQEAYKRGATNPAAALAAKEKMAMMDRPVPAAPAASIPGVKFTKGFSPAERAQQRAALKAKLAELGED